MAWAARRSPPKRGSSLAPWEALSPEAVSLRFPYGLLYRLLEWEIVVLAVMHLHRKPDYWKR